MSGSKQNVIAGAAATVTVIGVALVLHGAHQPEPCITVKLVCPEPERFPVDTESHGRPSGPPLPTRSAFVTTGPTGPGNTIIVPGTGTFELTGFPAGLTTGVA